MNIIRYTDTTLIDHPTIVSVGNFDGVHTGHAALVREVVDQARTRGLHSCIATFDPHTRAVLSPGKRLDILTTLEEKAVLLEALGVEFLVVIPFSPEFAARSPEQFAREVVIRSLHARGWVMGADHSFGSRRAGDINFLHNRLGRKHFILFVPDFVQSGTTVISSTRIREKIGAGDMGAAMGMLGHPYLIRAGFIRGHRVGRRLGYPTLNFASPVYPKVLPPTGVYAAAIEYRGAKRTGALYYGDCPTMGGRELHFEFYALRPPEADPAPGEGVLIWLYRHIRENRRFASAEHMRKQIADDMQSITNYFTEEHTSWH